MKEKRKTEIATLRMLKAAIFNKEKEKRYKLSQDSNPPTTHPLSRAPKPELSGEELEKESQLSDEEVVEVIFGEIKKRKESILEFEKGKRGDLVKKEKAEMKVLQEYLPEQLSEGEIKKLANESIEKVEAKNLKDMGKVMSELMPKLKGKAEGSLVSKIVKELLTPKTE